MTELLEIVSSVLALLGAALFLASGVALWRFPDVYTRMHGPTKAASLGLALIGSGVLVDDIAEGAGFWPEELLILLFGCLTLPISAQVLLRAAANRGIEADERTRGRPPSAEPPCSR